MTAVALLILRLLFSPILLPIGLIYGGGLRDNLRSIWTGEP